MLGVAFTLLCGTWLEGQQSALADKVIRLHVIANSDSSEDQALKLKVRDRILEESKHLISSGSTVEEAAQQISADLPAMAEMGSQVVQEQGYSYPVSASLEDNVWFPTKNYTDFSLPAGKYTALRIVIGEGKGQNWWCVVFPPLCLGSVSETVQETAYADGLNEQDVGLMTGESEGYIIKFKAIELWDQWTHS
ncbi:MAG: stage II sporulation protein R [Intestinimonas sp.]|nr:stage II sporulation protein R [Intestinimonas sp.]